MHRRRRRQSNVVLSVCILHLPAIYATPSMVQGSRAKRAFPFLPPLWDFQLSRRGCCLPSAGSVGLSTVHLAGAAEPATTQVKTLLPRGRANPPNALSTDLDIFTPVGGARCKSSSSPASQPAAREPMAPCALLPCNNDFLHQEPQQQPPSRPSAPVAIRLRTHHPVLVVRVATQTHVASLSFLLPVASD
ncbi:hypothetical protein HDK64DRAFT_86619 [Phyllosticta capitalensis]